MSDDAPCVCGHPAAAHDAGECWTDADNVEHPKAPCPCGWYRPALAEGDR